MRVILADDSILFREGLARLLTEAGLEVTGQAGTAERLLGLVRADPPDVAVVDIRMPPTHTEEGLDAARRIRAEQPGVDVLVLSQYVETHYAVQLLEDAAGAAARTAATGGAGYLLKDQVTRLDELPEAVGRVGHGDLVVDPAVVARLVARQRVRNPLDDLSERERDVLALMAEGRSNAAIARRLHLSAKTVEAHVRGVFTRFGLPATADDNRRVLAVLTFLRG